jgi:hypothetical protein
MSDASFTLPALRMLQTSRRLTQTLRLHAAPRVSQHHSRTCHSGPTALEVVSAMIAPPHPPQVDVWTRFVSRLPAEYFPL